MKTFRPGPEALRHRIQLFEATDQSDGMGGHSQTWTVIATLWAAIEPVWARERDRARAQELEVTHRIVVRHRYGVRPKMQVRLGQRVFAIVSVIDPDETHRYLEIEAIEEVSP